MNAPIDVSFFHRPAKPLTSYRPYWAKRFGTAPFLPMSRAEMEALGWDSCDVILVTGDAYVDHPSFGMAVIGRVLEAQGFRVGTIAQPDWTSAEAFKALGKPNLFWGVTAGNMDSMINRYTADRKIRSDDAYTPGDVGGKRPDRAAIVYSQRCREAFKDVPLVLGGIEGSLRRIAHYDYWSDKVRRSVVVDSKCDLLLYGNAERALVEVAHRLAAREPVERITDVRGTAFVRRPGDPSAEGWFEIDSSEVDQPGRVDAHINPYQTTSEQAQSQGGSCTKEDAPAPQGATVQPLSFVPNPALQGKAKRPPRDRSVIRKGSGGLANRSPSAAAPPASSPAGNPAIAQRNRWRPRSWVRWWRNLKLARGACTRVSRRISGRGWSHPALPSQKSATAGPPAASAIPTQVCAGTS